MLGRIDEQVLDDPLQLGSIGGQVQRRGIHHHRVVVVHVGVVDHAVDQGAEVDQLAARGKGAAGEPVQIQQVAKEPIKLAGVARQPLQQVGQVAGGQAGGAVLQGEGDAQDGRQGRAQIMGDRLQEGGLHLIHGTQVLGRGPFALQGGGELVGGLLLAVQRLSQVVGGQVGGGDVGQDPLPEQGAAVAGTDQDRLVADPAHLAVGGAHAVLAREWLPGLVGPLTLGRDPFQVLGMHQPVPQLGVADAVGSRHAHQRLDLRAHIEDRIRRLGAERIHHPGEAFQQRLQARLDIDQAPLKLAAGRQLGP